MVDQEHEALQRTRQVWESGMHQETTLRVSWTAIPYFEEQIARQLTGPYAGTGPHALAIASARYAWALLQERLPAPVHEALTGAVLVCGNMSAEALFFEQATGVRFQAVHGYDLSPRLLDQYCPSGLVFHAHPGDGNDLILDRSAFHLIVGCHGVHHLKNLGGCFYQAAKGLTPGGLLLLHEWIGPNYLQIPWRNRWVARVLLYLLFPSRASRTLLQGHRKGRWIMPRPEEVDPSEACNSQDLWPQYVRFFRPLRSVFYGGLVYPMFEGLGHHYVATKWTHRARVRVVYALERWLTKWRLIAPLFVSTIGEPRASND